MRALVRAVINQAYASRDPKRARRLLENLARELELPTQERLLPCDGVRSDPTERNTGSP